MDQACIVTPMLIVCWSLRQVTSSVNANQATMVLGKCVQVWKICCYWYSNKNVYFCTAVYVKCNLLFTDVCTGYCDNEGTCVKDSRGQPSCRCIGSFTGKHCQEKSEFAYIAGGIAGAVIFIIIIVLLVWMICVRSVSIPLSISVPLHIQWNFYSSFSLGVWKRNNGSGKTIDAGAIVEIGFAQGP
jgi:hypothetical protein